MADGLRFFTDMVRAKKTMSCKGECLELHKRMGELGALSHALYLIAVNANVAID